MRMLLRTLIALALTLSSTTASASCTAVEAACKRVISASGEYISQLKIENEMQQALLDQYEVTERVLRKDVSRLDKELNSWYRDPATLVLIGLLVGVTAGISIAK